MAGNFAVELVTGLEALILADDVVKAGKQAVAEEVAARIKETAPVGTYAEDDKHPGAFRDSITASNGVIRSDVEWASFVEFGVPSRQEPPQYIFRNAAESLGYTFKVGGH